MKIRLSQNSACLLERCIKMHIQHICIGSLLILESVGCMAQSQPITVCYVPFHYETSTPVTPSSIFQEKCLTIGTSDPVAGKLLTLVSVKPKIWNGQPDFNFLFVRLEISKGSDPPLFVDQNGVVLISNERYPLGTSTLSDIEKLLNVKFGYPPE